MRLRPEDLEFKASVGYIVKLCLQQITNNNQIHIYMQKRKKKEGWREGEEGRKEGRKEIRANSGFKPNLNLAG
jgi:hypothetical protein